MFRYQAALSLSRRGRKKLSPNGRIPIGVAYRRPERRPRCRRMPTTGIQRLPAINKTIGLTKAATNRTARRARGPRLMALVVLLIQPGRATAGQCDVRAGCHIPGACPLLLSVANSLLESNERLPYAWSNHHRFLL